MRKRLLQFLAHCFMYCGLLSGFLALVRMWKPKRQGNQCFSFPFIVPSRDARFQILAYHRVNDDLVPFGEGVPVRIFTQQMEILRRYFHVYPLEELLVRAAANDIPREAVAITFDDGYRDNYIYAFPVLKRLKLSASIFLTTGSLDNGPPLWHDRVFDAFYQAKVSSLSIEDQHYPLNTLSEKRSALKAFRWHLRKYDYREWGNLVDELRERLGISSKDVHLNAQKLYWSEIKEMALNGISFGAHTATHPILTCLSASEAKKEIVLSKTVIERELGRPVKLFAYPNGNRDDFNSSLKETLKEAGFLGSVTTIRGLNNAETDPFELRRLGGQDIDPHLFALQLAWYKFSL